MIAKPCAVCAPYPNILPCGRKLFTLAKELWLELWGTERLLEGM